MCSLMLRLARVLVNQYWDLFSCPYDHLLMNRWFALHESRVSYCSLDQDREQPVPKSDTGNGNKYSDQAKIKIKSDLSNKSKLTIKVCSVSKRLRKILKITH